MDITNHLTVSLICIGGFSSKEIPQIVLLTFDDSVNDLNREIYKKLFEEGRTNPNGCPVRSTFYVSHEWTGKKIDFDERTRTLIP